MSYIIFIWGQLYDNIMMIKFRAHTCTHYMVQVIVEILVQVYSREEQSIEENWVVQLKELFW